MQTTVGRTRTHGYERSVNDVSVAMVTKRRKLRSPEDGFCNGQDALLPGFLLNAARKKFYQWQFTFACNSPKFLRLSGVSFINSFGLFSMETKSGKDSFSFEFIIDWF
ncbi:hypothetical protein NPIL_396351 [Nephila pilipes]|uniref:Uncharacterized protein n=1 Tax=Nephila pilipes TaxID=299642 RepID=A0A8X6I6F5_NEPPI|nr:hypothetical protein NPIL_396351 [Nephila pilipes]